MGRCPICGSELKRLSEYNDFVSVVEYHDKCIVCNLYEEDYAYGNTEIRLGNFLTGYSHSLIGEDRKNLYKEINGLSKILRETHNIKYFNKEDTYYYISINYGVINPCLMELCSVSNDNTIILIDQYYYDSRTIKKIKTDEELYNELEKLAKGYDILYIEINPSAASFIETIKKHNKFNIKHKRLEVNKYE